MTSRDVRPTRVEISCSPWTRTVCIKAPGGRQWTGRHTGHSISRARAWHHERTGADDRGHGTPPTAAGLGKKLLEIFVFFSHFSPNFLDFTGGSGHPESFTEEQAPPRARDKLRWPASRSPAPSAGSLGAMSAPPRRRLTMVLLLLLFALTEHCCAGTPSAAAAAAAVAAARSHGRTLQVVTHLQRNHGGRRELCPSGVEEQREGEGAEQSPVSFPRDPKKKEKFIKHLTGPLIFSPKCRKIVYRLYHHTRECTIPAFFKRCARMLSRLAGSTQCMDSFRPAHA